ncbi:hypothetical protein [Geothrix rubra]|uniref:hypothetical protein n=1 Tax=Geothrix rubra TaxID=2927977 RepID=UPI0025563142|nr:hypothetical protein [Geothrix rubra]
MAPKPGSFLLPLALTIGLPSLAHSGPDRPLFAQKSKDRLVYREVLSNGDFCQVREYVGEEHVGLRVVYFIPERTLDETALRRLIRSLIQKHCGKREVPLLSKALDQFNSASSKTPDHWFIQVKDRSYSECFIIANWLGESITVEIKYYK